jgi:hypothetical protein
LQRIRLLYKKSYRYRDKKINNAGRPIKHVNTFEVAVLRILIKRQQPIKLSALVSGFPDDCEDSVLSAISSLKLHGYIQIDDYQPNGYISIISERRKEVLQIVDSDIYPRNFDAHNKGEKSAPAIKEKKGFLRIVARYPISQGSRAIAISLLLVLGLVSALGMIMPATSPDTEFVTHNPYIAHKKWAGGGGVHGENERADGMIPSSSYTPSAASFVALKNCNLSQSQLQT